MYVAQAVVFLLVVSISRGVHGWHELDPQPQSYLKGLDLVSWGRERVDQADVSPSPYFSRSKSAHSSGRTTEVLRSHRSHTHPTLLLVILLAFSGLQKEDPISY